MCAVRAFVLVVYGWVCFALCLSRDSSYSLSNTQQNRRLKQTLLKILRNKQRRVGEDALREMLADLKVIEADEGAWRSAGKEELDYVQIVLHGLQMGVADENGRLLDDVVWWYERFSSPRAQKCVKPCA